VVLRETRAPAAALTLLTGWPLRERILDVLLLQVAGLPGLVFHALHSTTQSHVTICIGPTTPTLGPFGPITTFTRARRVELAASSVVLIPVISLLIVFSAHLRLHKALIRILDGPSGHWSPSGMNKTTDTDSTSPIATRGSSRRPLGTGPTPSIGQQCHQGA
jgi:hypothetical protein